MLPMFFCGLGLIGFVDACPGLWGHKMLKPSSPPPSVAHTGTQVVRLSAIQNALKGLRGLWGDTLFDADSGPCPPAGGLSAALANASPFSNA